MSDGEEMKKRMYSCILVVGGGLMFAGAYSWLQHRVWINMPPQARIGLEVMDVITRPKVMHHCQSFYQENYFCFFFISDVFYPLYSSTRYYCFQLGITVGWVQST